MVEKDPQTTRDRRRSAVLFPSVTALSVVVWLLVIAAFNARPDMSEVTGTALAVVMFATLMITIGLGAYFFSSWKGAFMDGLVRLHALAPIVQVRELPNETRTSIMPRWRRVALVAAPLAQLPLLAFAFDISPGFWFLGLVVWMAAGPISLWWGWSQGLRSRIHVGSEGVRVVNPAWTIRIPWSELVSLGVTEVVRGQHLSETYRAFCLVFNTQLGEVTAAYPCCRNPRATDLTAAHRAAALAIQSGRAARDRPGKPDVQSA